MIHMCELSGVTQLDDIITRVIAKEQRDRGHLFFAQTDCHSRFAPSQ